jgi:hypothetical protein
VRPPVDCTAGGVTAIVTHNRQLQTDRRRAEGSRDIGLLPLAAGINQFAFAGGDPINGSDPSGTDWCGNPDDPQDPEGCAGGDFPPGSVWPSATFTCTVNGDAAALAACTQAATEFMNSYANDSLSATNQTLIPSAAGDSLANSNAASAGGSIGNWPPTDADFRRVKTLICLLVTLCPTPRGQLILRMTLCPRRWIRRAPAMWNFIEAHVVGGLIISRVYLRPQRRLRCCCSYYYC